MNANKDLNYSALCKYCFAIVEYYLIQENKKDNNAITMPEFPKEFVGQSYPLFITWKIDAKDELRGCIGTFSKEKLEKNLKYFALNSAFNDDRFSPISLKELPKLNVSVSLLTNFEKCDNPFDWEIGKHGIEIDFEHRGENYNATFLPSVAVEHNFDHQLTLLHLIDKAGFDGNIKEILPKIKTTRYQALKSKMTYKEYKESK